MSTDVILFDQNTALPAAFAGMVDQIGGDLSGGVQGSYAILSFKGSRFAVKYQGNSQVITNEQGDPVGSFEAVLVKSNPYLTKQYYVNGYVEGDNAAPDCFSIDGKVPSDQSPLKQHTNCAACPMNAFTKINEQTGKKTKACQDNRKVAVLPGDDLVNELFGGPMLMRVPAASLKDLAMFGDTLKARGFTYNSVRVRISFDLTVSYPKLILKAIRPLTEEEAVQVIEWYGSDVVNKMLADFADIKVPVDQAAPAVDEVFEQPQAAAPVAKPVPPVVKTAPVAAAKPAAAPAAPPAQAAKPAGVSFGAKAAAPKAAAPAAPAVVKAPAAAKPKAQAPAAPVAAQPAVEPETDTTTEVIPGNLENDIAGILADLNSISGE
jgi:hypothetical protein